VNRSITLVDLQLDAQNSYLFTYNTFIKIVYMFRAIPVHLQEVYVVIVYMQPLESSLSAGDCPVHRLRKNCSILPGAQQSHLQRVTIAEAAYRVSHELRSLLRKSVPYVKIYRYNPKHVYPKLNGYGDNGQRKVWSSGGSTHCTLSADSALQFWPRLQCQITEIPLALHQYSASELIM
jgi:hypothetical protein